MPGTLAFTDGNGTASVDQYQGTAGNGWLEGWVPSGTITASIVATAPIGSGGNYLSLADVNGGQGVARQFLAPTTYPYRLMLDLRVDAIPTSGTINLSTGSARSVNTDATNYVQVNADVTSGNPTPFWRFVGSSGSGNSNIQLFQGTTYHFDFLVNPVAKSYTVTILDGSSTYTSSTISFRNQNAPVANPYFELGRQGVSTDPAFSFSLDNIVFAPEPSSHFTDGGSGSDWATADNWDNGVPIAQTFAHIGAGNSATLGTTGVEAFQVIIGHTGSTLPGNGTLTQTGGDLTVANGLLIGVNTAGTSDISGDYTATGGRLTVGSLANRGNIILGYNSAGNTTDAFGTLDLSGASQFDAYLDELSIGEVTSSASNGTGGGTLKLAPTSNIDAKEIMVSWSNMHMATQPTSTIQLGVNTAIKADTFTVAGFRGMALVEFGTGGGTLTLSGSSGTETDLLIANCDSGTNNPVNGHMDMSGGTFNATLDRLLIGYDLTGTGGGGSIGKLTFAAGTVTANSLTLGDAGSGLGNGTLNMSGGSLTVNGNATLGTGTTVSLGTLNLAGGTIAVSGDVTGGAGLSTINVDGGTMTVGSDLIVDTLRVGNGALAGNLTVNGETVEIGSETNRTNLYIARSTTSNLNNPKSTVDLSGATQLTAYLDKLNIGERVGGGTSTLGKPIAEVILAPTTLIDARSVLISEYDIWGDNASQTQFRIGADTTMRTDLFTIGGTRGNALVNFFNGGTFTLEGSANAAADLRVGYCTAGTTNATTGNLNLTGGTFNATLDELVVAYRVYRGESDVTTNATMSFDAGTVTANSVTLGWGTQPTSNDGTMGIGIGTLNMGGGSLTVGTVALGAGTTKSKGTLNLSGGTLSAHSITQGVGIGTFNFTGGTLHVGTFGSEARPFDLVQAGGTLAPGSSPGMTTIYGNYTMAAAGALEIEINGLDQGDQGLVGDADDGIGYDFVMVDGNASLAGSLNVLFLDGFYPVLGTHFDVLQTTGNLDITGLTLNDDLAPLTFGWWEMATIPGVGGEGFTLRLSAVPEPSSLLLLAVVLLAGCVRRRRR